MSAVLSSDFNKRIIQMVLPLQENPWRPWSKGTVVVREETEGDPTADTNIVVPAEVHYEVVEQGKSVHRIQEIGGRSKRQEFMVMDEEGLPSAESHSESIQSALNIDNMLIISEFRKINASTTDYENIVNYQYEQWSLAAEPSILLRHSTESEKWFIRSLQAYLVVSGDKISCIEVESKKQISPEDFIVTRRKLAAGIPGHLGEEIRARVHINKETGKTLQQITSHQVVTKIKIA